ncbi:MAG TPA: POTRA domain-containing protein [Bryobacteraceae bacterium]|nr:POTRA domain-containing protein [Bryobacteraceae bacterium]
MRLLLLLTFALSQAPAQENSLEGKPVVAVMLSPAADYLHPEDLQRALSPLSTDKALAMPDVRLTIERLYATGRFENIIAHAEEEPGSGVRIRFEVQPAQFVRNVTIVGAEQPPSPGQMVNASGLQLGQRYSPTQVSQSIERILELLRSNGLYRAQISPEVHARDQQQVDITFHIQPGERARYETPIVRGTPGKTVEELVRDSRWRRWFGFGPFKEVTDNRTQQGLERIRRSYLKRDFLMARTGLDGMDYREDENRAVPLLNVDSGQKVMVRATGAKVSRGRLRELVPVYQELSVDKDLLVEGDRELTEHLQARGYFEAEVDFEVIREQDRQVVLYSIAPGPRHKLVHVAIEGNSYFDDATLRERMYTTPASLIRFRQGRFSQDYLRRDTGAIRALYQTNGFRDVDVEARVVDDYRGRKDDVAVLFEVDEGPQSRVSTLRIEGVDAALADQLRGMLQSLEGQPYSELNLGADQDTVLAWFYNNGYPQARFEAAVKPAAEPYRFDLVYTVTPGERQYVRDVLISGLRSTDLELVRSRIRNLSGGDALQQSAMIDSQRRLYDLGIFARVDTALQNSDGETDHKYVLYRFEEASRWSVNAGFGAQIARIGRGRPSLDTPAGAPGFGPRISFGVNRNNIFGIGHTVTLQTQWAPGLRQRGVLTYLAPQIKGDDDLNLTFTGLFDDSRDVQTFNSRRREVAVQLAQRVTRANTLQYRVSWRRVSVSDVVITPELVPIFARPIQVATLSGTFIQDRRDDPIEARRGVWNTIDGTYAFNTWEAPNTVFTRLLGRNATYHPVTREVTIARQLSFGVQFRHSAQDVPFPERFFAGGVSSHRAFPDNQAGPRDLLTGFPVGGKALLMHNTELRFPLLGDNVGGVLFHDAGNVYQQLRDFSFRVSQRDRTDFNYMVHAVGFGVRYRTPIGPVRIDLAFSPNSPRFRGLKGTLDEFLDPNANIPVVDQRISRFQFHFSLGQLF